MLWDLRICVTVFLKILKCSLNLSTIVYRLFWVVGLTVRVLQITDCWVRRLKEFSGNTRSLCITEINFKSLSCGFFIFMTSFFFLSVSISVNGEWQRMWSAKMWRCQGNQKLSGPKSASTNGGHERLKCDIILVAMKSERVLEGELAWKLCISHFGLCHLKKKHVLFRTEYTEKENHVSMGKIDFLWEVLANERRDRVYV